MKTQTRLVSRCLTFSLLSLTALFSLQASAESSNDHDEWAKLPFETQFIDGCMKGEKLTKKARKSKKEFCQCAFTAYKGRYTPQEFSQINSLAVEIGENGPALVNLMMRPELDECSDNTGYSRS